MKPNSPSAVALLSGTVLGLVAAVPAALGAHWCPQSQTRVCPPEQVEAMVEATAPVQVFVNTGADAERREPAAEGQQRRSTVRATVRNEHGAFNLRMEDGRVVEATRDGKPVPMSRVQRVEEDGRSTTRIVDEEGRVLAEFVVGVTPPEAALRGPGQREAARRRAAERAFDVAVQQGVAAAEPKIMIGLRLSPVPAVLRQHLGLGEGGAMVVGVAQGLVANAAGIKPSDVLLSVDGKAVTDDSQALRLMLEGGKPGQEMVLEVVSGGKKSSVTVRPEAYDAKRMSEAAWQGLAAGEAEGEMPAEIDRLIGRRLLAEGFGGEMPRIELDVEGDGPGLRVRPRVWVGGAGDGQRDVIIRRMREGQMRELPPLPGLEFDAAPEGLRQEFEALRREVEQLRREMGARRRATPPTPPAPPVPPAPPAPPAPRGQREQGAPGQFAEAGVMAKPFDRDADRGIDLNGSGDYAIFTPEEMYFVRFVDGRVQDLRVNGKSLPVERLRVVPGSVEVLSARGDVRVRAFVDDQPRLGRVKLERFQGGYVNAGPAGLPPGAVDGRPPAEEEGEGSGNPDAAGGGAGGVGGEGAVFPKPVSMHEVIYLPPPPAVAGRPSGGAQAAPSRVF